MGDDKRTIEALINRLESENRLPKLQIQEFRDKLEEAENDSVRLAFLLLTLIQIPGLMEVQTPIRGKIPGKDQSIEVRAANYVARLQAPPDSEKFKSVIAELAQEPELLAPANSLFPNGFELLMIVTGTEGLLTQTAFVESPVHRLFAEILSSAYASNSDTIEINLNPENRTNLSVRFRIGNQWQEHIALPKNLGLPLQGAIHFAKALGYRGYRQMRPEKDALPPSLRVTRNEDLIQLHFYPFKPKEQIIQELKDAFPAVPWPKDELAAIGDDGDLDCNFIIEHYQGKTWLEMTRHELGWAGSDGWAFAEDALIHFLPAFLLADLDGGQITPFLTERLAKYLQDVHPPLAERLTDAQLRVIQEAIVMCNPEGEDQNEDSYDTSLHDLLNQLRAHDYSPNPLE